MPEKYAFISYSRKDLAFVEAFVKQLRQARYNVFWDKEDIRVTKKWKEEIAKKIKNCSIMLAFVSANFVESKHCQVELGYANDNNCVIAQIYLDDAVKLPEGLDMYNNGEEAVNWENFCGDYDKLLSILKNVEEFSACKHVASDKKYPVRECKVIFLGDGGSGKSSLIEMLINGNVLENPETTNGVVSSPWDYEIRKELYHLELVEFGGQESMWSMHYCLLTQNTVYVIVCDGKDQFIDNAARRWLKVVQSYAPECPIIFAVNKTEDDDYFTISDEIARNGECVITSAAQKDRKGVHELIITIKEAVLQCPHSFVADITDVKSALKRQKRDYISIEKYYQICFEKNIIDNALSNELLELLQNLGAAYHFETDGDNKQNLVILNPNWLTNGIYRVIVHKRDGAENAIPPHSTIIHDLSVPDSKAILPQMKYSEKETIFIIGVMRKFQICYELQKGKELIPLKMEKTEPEEYDSFKKSDALHLRWSSDFLPMNIVYCIMVRKAQELYSAWQSGGLFRRGPFEALVELTDIEGKPCLDVYVTSVRLGDSREYLKEFRNQVKSVFQEMNFLGNESFFWKRLVGEKDVEAEIKLKAVGSHHAMGVPDLFVEEVLDNVKIIELLSQTYLDPNEVLKDISENEQE